MTPPPLEAALEATFRHRIRRAGGLAIKLAPTMRGVPDRLVLLPGGGLYLVELKRPRPYGRLSPIQEVWHERASQLGVPVYVLYGVEDIDPWLAARRAELDSRAGLWVGCSAPGCERKAAPGRARCRQHSPRKTRRPRGGDPA